MNHSASEAVSPPDGQQQASTLQPRLLKGVQAHYIPTEWTGENTSGLIVFGNHVLVAMDECSPYSAGGIRLPEEMAERMTMASESGCIFALGDSAFTYYDDGRPWAGLKPSVGQRVYVERYAGVVAMGADGRCYRIMGYGCISAGLAGETSQ